MKHLLCIPVYNEEATLQEVLAETRARLDESLSEILLINDGSSDGSRRIIEEARAQDSRIRAIHRPVNQGYGAAMIDSLARGRAGGFDYVITMDCDRQHRPEDLARFVAHDPEISVVSGSRYLAESDRKGQAPEDRVAVNERITRLLNRTYGWALTDSFCGFKRYRTDQIDPGLFTERGYAFPLEFWAYARGRGLSIEEIPVSRIYTTDDRSFGEDLDKIRKRYKYYLQTFYRARKRFER